MARLTDTARDAVATARKAPTLPSWWIAGGGVLLAVVAAFLLFQILRPAPADPFTVAPPAQLPPLPSAAPVPDLSDPSQQGDVQPVLETVRVVTDTGPVDVPRRAVEVAKAAVVGLYTGDFSKVTFAPGTTPPEPRGRAATVVVPDPYYASTVADSGDAVFLFKIDPDQTGPKEETTVTITVTADADIGFAYKPE